MGFDFHWIHEPPPVAALRVARDALETDTDLLPGWREANSAYYEACREHGVHWSGSYSWFHRAIESEMRRLGMVYGTPEMEQAYRAFRHPGDHEWAENDDCCADARLFKHWRDDPGPSVEQGIPFYKFCGSDGWLVLPEEITAALVRFEAAREAGWHYRGDSENARDFDWWLRFMYCARGYGGFRVR